MDGDDDNICIASERWLIVSREYAGGEGRGEG